MTPIDKLNFLSKFLVLAPPLIFDLLLHRAQAVKHRWTYRAVPSPKDIVVIGGSYTGVHLARRLYDSVPTGYRVTLIERNSHLNYVINFARYSVLTGHEKYGFIPYDGIGDDAPQGSFQYIQDTVDSIKDGQVHLRSGGSIDFAYLAIATGSQQGYTSQLIASDKETGCKNLQTMQERIQKANRIAVVGAGAVGIELATDIKSFYPEKDVTIYHSRPRLLPQFGFRLQDYVLNKLQEAGIHVVLQERPEILTEENSLRLSNGTIEQYDLILPCTGQKANSNLIQDLAPEAVCDKTKQILVRPTLQIAADENEEKGSLANIFALGDVAATGGPKNARSGFFQVEIAVKNILAMIDGSKTLNTYKPYRVVEGAVTLTLGKEDAVAYLQEDDGTDILYPIKARGEDMNIKKAWNEMNAKFPES